MKKRLKIGLFIDSYYPAIDGVVLVVDNLARELSKNNDVIVVAPYAGKYDDTSLPYKVVRVNSIPVPFMEYRIVNHKGSLSKYYHELVKENFDIIHIHSPFNVGKLGLKIAQDTNIPCIATMHTRFDFEIRKRVNNETIIRQLIKHYIKVYNECNACICVNNAMVDVFKDFGYKYEPVVIYNGTDLKESTDEKLINDLKKKYKIKDEPIFLFVGRIIDIKNIFFILEALKLLSDEKFKFKMFYAGTGPDEHKLKETIKNYNLDDKVFMLGKITDRSLLSTIYKMSDLFLFPSKFDASSLVQIEAAVNGTPGLFLEGSVTSDTVTNDFNGFKSKDDVNAYKEKIKEIMSDKNKLEIVSKNAKETLGKSWTDISKETYNLYLSEIDKMNKTKN